MGTKSDIGDILNFLCRGHGCSYTAKMLGVACIRMDCISVLCLHCSYFLESIIPNLMKCKF